MQVLPDAHRRCQVKFGHLIPARGAAGKEKAASEEQGGCM